MKKLLLCLLLLVCCGCSPIVKVNEDAAARLNEERAASYNAAAYPVTITSLNSRNEQEQQVYTRPPQRVVAVWQNSIETLIALGVGDRIMAGMGVPNRECILPQYRAQYDKIPYTSLENLDLETVMMMRPDFVLGWYSTFGDKVLRSTEFWKQRGVHSYIAASSGPTLTRHTLQEEYDYILDMGKIFDRQEKARELVDAMQQEITFATEKNAHIKKRPTAIVIELVGKEIRVYGAKSLAGDIVGRLNGELLEPEAINFSLEQLVDLNPDAIFLVVIESQYGNDRLHLQRIYENRALQSLKCVQEKRVYTVPLYAVYTSGVRSYYGIKTIARGLYPDLYKE